MNKRRSLSMDRVIAIVLLIGSIFVAFDIRYELTTNHSLWSLGLVHDFIWPLGFVIIGFWTVASFSLFSTKVRLIGWVISAIWHFGWLVYLVATIFGFIVFFGTAPFLFVWMIFAGSMSIAAGVKIQDHEREKLA